MSLLLHRDVIKTPSVQTWFVYFFVSFQPLSTNFGPEGFQFVHGWRGTLHKVYVPSIAWTMSCSKQGSIKQFP